MVLQFPFFEELFDMCLAEFEKRDVPRQYHSILSKDSVL